jgi:hypothetical protein
MLSKPQGLVRPEVLGKFKISPQHDPGIVVIIIIILIIIIISIIIIWPLGC